MKKLLSILSLISISSFAGQVNIEYEDVELGLQYNNNGEVTLTSPSSFLGKIKIESDKYPRSECKEYRTNMDNVMDRVIPFELESFSRQRDLNAYLIFKGRSAIKDVTILPYGFDLTNSDFQEEIKEKTGLRSIKAINPGVFFSSISLNLVHGKKSILSLYPQEVRSKIVQIFQDKIMANSNYIEGMRRGSFEVTSSSAEIMCDLLHFDTKIEVNFEFQNPEEVVDKVAIDPLSVKKLYRKLKSEINRPENLDGFKAGFYMAKAVEETGFVFPAKLKKVYGSDQEYRFYEAFFDKNLNWMLRSYTKRNEQRILGHGYYVKTRPGKVIEIDSALEVEKK